MQKEKIAEILNLLSTICHEASRGAGWWHDPETGEDLLENIYAIATKIALIHSEGSEVLEAHRRGLMDDKLPHRSGVECELADVLIRSFDLAGALKLDLGGAVVEKMSFNAVRPDHKIVNRRAPGGKKY